MGVDIHQQQFGCNMPVTEACYIDRLIGARIDAEAIGSDHRPIWVELRG
jgi:hypothetical protein